MRNPSVDAALVTLPQLPSDSWGMAHESMRRKLEVEAEG